MSFATKVSPDGEGVDSKNLLLDDTYSAWKCDMRKNPRHFGIVQATISRIGAETRTVFTMNHGYGYVPSFLVAWGYPAGTDSVGSTTRQTFGVGLLQVTNPVFTQFTYKVNLNTFSIIVTSSGAQSNLYAEFRYFIFAEDFPLAADTSSFFA